MKLRSRMFISIFIVIIFLGIAGAFLGFILIQQDIVARSQEEVKRDLKSMRAYYDGKIEQLGIAVTLMAKSGIKTIDPKDIGADYICSIPYSDSINSLIVKNAFTGIQSSGSRLVDSEELKSINENFTQRVKIKVVETPKARPTKKSIIDNALVIEFAIPTEWENGNVSRVLYAGKIINNENSFVRDIHEFVYEDSKYDEKPIGTVTVFLDDVRIATNVLDEKGQTAIGTRVSDVVYKKVIGEGQIFLARAFVVTDWYLTAYEPIVDPAGNRIGILYVGRLEKPFLDMILRFFLIFSVLLLGTIVLGALLTFILASTISRPVIEMVQTTQKIAQGNYIQEIGSNTKIKEIRALSNAFNNMMHEIELREKSLHNKSEELSALNKSHLDLISFVSHELKGILSSTILNAYTVRDGFLGMVNFKQRKALDSITRNLDHLAETVKNFLNLSRIEKGELEIHKSVCMLNEDIFAASLDAFKKTIEETGIEVINEMPKELAIEADRDMLFVVANNLVGNAIKYGKQDGRIILKAQLSNNSVRIEVYNDGEPISVEDGERMFQKFVRLGYAAHKRVKGTGLGLHITKIIIESHNGHISCEPKEKGNNFIITIPRGEYEQTT